MSTDLRKLTKEQALAELIEYYNDDDVVRHQNDDGDRYYVVDGDLFDEFMAAHGATVKSEESTVHVDEEDVEDEE